MNFDLPGAVKQFMTKFVDANFEIYVVGGAVRDILMGKIVYDWDFTTNATPDEILAIVEGGLYNNLYGTVFTPNPDGDRPYEITTFRKEEGYSDSRHPDKIEWGKTLEEDLKRRDFTINALTFDGNKIIDLFEGQNDLNNKLIKAVGDPNERFNEDALRMMRAVRIGGELNFKIERETLEAIKTNSTLINKIAKERVKDELFKILKS